MMVDAMDGAKSVKRIKGVIACDVTCYVLYYSLRHITGQLSCFVTFVIGGIVSDWRFTVNLNQLRTTSPWPPCLSQSRPANTAAVQ